MARPKKTGLSIAELEQMLTQRKSAITKLTKQRAVVQKKLDAIDREIAALGGKVGVSHTSSGRARNEMSLVDALAAVLKEKPPMQVGEILDAVQANGYTSTSENFRGIVNQALIKDKRFTQAARGMYTIK